MAASPVVDATTSTFEHDVIQASQERPVVVDFWAAWCGPCRVLGPTLERLAREHDGRWTLVKVDVDKHAELANRYGVQGIPAVFAFVDGEVVDQFTGALPTDQVRAFIDRIAPDPSAAEAARGDAAWQAGDRDGARAAWSAALARDASQPEALMGLAELALHEGAPEEARRLLTALPERLDDKRSARRTRLTLRCGGHGDVQALLDRVADDPNDPDARWAAAEALAAAARWDEALGHLLHLVKQDRSYREDGARKQMLRLFEAVGVRSPIADRWRAELAKVLY